MKNNKKSAIVTSTSLLLLILNYQYIYNNIKIRNIDRITRLSYMQSNTVQFLEYSNSITSITTLNILYLSFIYSSIINYKDYLLKDGNKYRILCDLSILLTFINHTDGLNYDMVSNNYHGRAHYYYDHLLVLFGILEKKNYNIKSKIVDAIIVLSYIVNEYIFNKDIRNKSKRLFFIQCFYTIHLLLSRYLNH